MPLKYGNRIKVSPYLGIAPSIGDFILGTPVSGYQSFAAAIPSITAGDTVRYVIEDGANWEIGIGTYQTAAGARVQRNIITQSTSAGSPIPATSAATIMVSVAAGDFLPSDGGTVTGTVVLPSTTSIGTVSSTEIGYLDGVTSAIQTQINTKAPSASPTLTGTIGLSGASSFSSSITEAVFTINNSTPTPAINPANGTIQNWTLAANATPTFASIATGQSVTLMIDNGSGDWDVTWTSTPGVTWLTSGGFAPALNLTGRTAIVLWNVSGVLYGARVGYV